jgi:hypothetical protein
MIKCPYCDSGRTTNTGLVRSSEDCYHSLKQKQYQCMNCFNLFAVQQPYISKVIHGGSIPKPID